MARRNSMSDFSGGFQTGMQLAEQFNRAQMRKWEMERQNKLDQANEARMLATTPGVEKSMPTQRVNLEMGKSYGAPTPGKLYYSPELRQRQENEQFANKAYAEDLLDSRRQKRAQADPKLAWRMAGDEVKTLLKLAEVSEGEEKAEYLEKAKSAKKYQDALLKNRMPEIYSEIEAANKKEDEIKEFSEYEKLKTKGEPNPKWYLPEMWESGRRPDEQKRFEELMQKYGATGKPAGAIKTVFNSVEEAEVANLPKGTRITVNGRPAIVE